jgi:D-alanyl-D-alanine carboxypeptidase/D-alanyl-D-alanine-endopeptidase (penicillin-binding protein 4)
VIKGYGDPLFTSESVRDLAESLAEALGRLGLGEVTGILVDGSFFEPGIEIPGAGSSANPYDALPGACCANFNTVAFDWDPASGAHVSAEPQTPLLPFVRKRIAASGMSRGRILLSRQECGIYAGILLGHFLEARGIGVTGPVTAGTAPAEAPILTHLSPHTLTAVIRQLMEYSSNFIANQLLLAVGASAYGPPATLEKGVRALRAYGADILGLGDLRVVEGSGISRENRLTPREMLTLLMAFRGHRTLMKTGPGEYYKTGTLLGVSTRVGFFQAGDGRLFPFVILVNAPDAGYEEIHRRLAGMIPGE